MQCFKVFLANELFYIFNIKVADPVIEVSDPKNHTRTQEIEIKIFQTFHNNLCLKNNNIYGFILMLYDSKWWPGSVQLVELHTSANIFKVLIASLIFLNMCS